jgi:peptidoglycan/xylan/chitin deacetylase (PgdA/CDA1 family)
MAASSQTDRPEQNAGSLPTEAPVGDQSAPSQSEQSSAEGGTAALSKARAKRAMPPSDPSQAPAERDETCPGRDALNTYRTIRVGAPGGLQLGLKSYPQTLDLADHEVVLTFDDGPLPQTTGRVLEALRRECVRATFFLIGRNAEANPQLVRQELREHHTVGHHSWSHPAITLRGLSEEAARQEIIKGIAADERAGYGDPTNPERPHVPFFRFPGFADSPSTLAWLASRHIAVFGADLWASDWLMLTPEAELNLVLSRLEQVKRGIILFHDTRSSTVAMLPSFLRELKKRGYRVVHLEPGSDRPPLQGAPAGWTSETEAIIGRVLPKLLARSKPEGRRAGPAPSAPGESPDAGGSPAAGKANK